MLLAGAQICPAENSSSTVSPPGTTERQEEEKFCNGYGTDMYMSGFKVSLTVSYCAVDFTTVQWAGDPTASCVILLFPSWLLTSRSRHFTAIQSLHCEYVQLCRFAAACCGVLGLGIAIEGLLWLRRRLQDRSLLRPVRGAARQGGDQSHVSSFKVSSRSRHCLCRVNSAAIWFQCWIRLPGHVGGHDLLGGAVPLHGGGAGGRTRHLQLRGGGGRERGPLLRLPNHWPARHAGKPDKVRQLSCSELQCAGVQSWQQGGLLLGRHGRAGCSVQQ